MTAVGPSTTRVSSLKWASRSLRQSSRLPMRFERRLLLLLLLWWWWWWWWWCSGGGGGAGAAVAGGDKPDVQFVTSQVSQLPCSFLVYMVWQNGGFCVINCSGLCYLHHVNRVNGRGIVFVHCVSVCVSVCLCLCSGPVNQTCFKRLKLPTSNLTRIFSRTVQTWTLKIFQKGAWMAWATWPPKFLALSANSSIRV